MKKLRYYSAVKFIFTSSLLLLLNSTSQAMQKTNPISIVRRVSESDLYKYKDNNTGLFGTSLPDDFDEENFSYRRDLEASRESDHVRFISRLAHLSDVQEILDLIENFDPVAKKALVIYPKECDIRINELTNDIKKSRIFIAVNSNGKIVGFLKMYIIKETHKLNDILTGEIRCINGKLFTSKSFTQKYETRNNMRKPKFQSFEPKNTPSYDDSNIYIYFGGAYTRKKDRGKGINYSMMSYALRELSLKTLIKDSYRTPHNIIMVYGQVADNLGSTGFRDCFVYFVKNVIGNSTPTIIHFRYQAAKPTLIYNNESEKVEAKFSTKFKDYGNVVIY